MHTTMDVDSLFAQESWDRDVYLALQRTAFAGQDSFERFRDLVGQLDRQYSGGGDSLAIALKLGLCQRLLGQQQRAAELQAKARPGALRDYYYGLTLRDLAQHKEALAAFERAAAAGWDEIDCACQRAETLLATGEVDAARRLHALVASAGSDRAAWHFVQGKLKEADGDLDGAIGAYEQAAELDPQEGRYRFRLAYLYDLHGSDERAMDMYEQCAALPVVRANALLNLAVLYEDNGDYDAALRCLRRVLIVDPNHARALLFLRDVEASTDMFIDEDQEREREEQVQILETPIGEFELSVRARNCLKKMSINSLGDLLRISEAELLAYKNFGETSLNEIRAMLSQKGLRLGQMAETTPRQRLEPRHATAVANPEALARPVAELELSVRSRKCLQRLAIATIGELCARTEAELLATRNFGQTSLNEIKRRLAELNLRLRRPGE